MIDVKYLLNNPQLVGDGSLSPEGFLEIIPKRLYWISLNQIPRNNQTHHFFSIDAELVYEPFFADFGPLNLSSTFRYCKLVNAILDDPQLGNKKIVHFCSSDPKKRANAAYLISCFQVMILRRPPDLAYKPFINIRPPLLPFRDATCGICNYHCTVLDCLNGLAHAMKVGWFDPKTFNVGCYEFYEKVEHGDMTWIVPDKFLAFAGPSATPIDPDGFPAFTPEDYVPIFKSGGVSLIVRLNKKQYDARRFTDHGIKHVDLYFLDGSCPNEEIINKFLYITENEPGAVAIHCKAGLGRTGTLIGLWAQKHVKFPGRAFIGWNRICRPGAILGPQQDFLVMMERHMFQAGEVQRANLRKQPDYQDPIEQQYRKALREGEIKPSSPTGKSITPKEMELALRQANLSVNQLQLSTDQMKEDVGQGNRLVAARRDGIENFQSKLHGRSGHQSLKGMFGPQPQIIGLPLNQKK